jgi:hypothetical protein
MTTRPTARPSLTCASVVLLAVGGAAGCKAYPTLKNLPLDCSVEDRYELQSIDPFETVGEPGHLWMSGDTPAAVTDFAVEELSDGARCGSSAALVLRARGQNDWGALFGYLGFGPRDASDYEGMSLWVRAPRNTGKNFTLLLDDPNTMNPSPDASPPVANCKLHGPDGGIVDGGTGQAMPVYGPNGEVIGMTGGGTSVPPDQCGNSYAANVIVTTDWRFYTVPFSTFQQGATPNRVPNAQLMETGSVPGNGLIASELLNLVFRMPKEQTMELWIDNLSLYRRRTAGSGSDGGADAPSM